MGYCCNSTVDYESGNKDMPQPKIDLTADDPCDCYIKSTPFAVTMATAFASKVDKATTVDYVFGVRVHVKKLIDSLKTPAWRTSFFSNGMEQ